MSTTTRPAPPAPAPVRPLPTPAPRRWGPEAVGAFVWATTLVVVALWEHHGGVKDLVAGPAEAITSLGRLTALVSSNLLLLQVLAMARIPVVERSLGQDRLARWHRVLGFTSITLLLAHLVLTTLGWSLLDGVALWSELWSLVTTAPGMLLAAAGTALLVLVGVTSARFARRRLRYESWHLLHLYAYLGVGLALPHQLWTGEDFLASTAATVYWWSLYAAALGAVLVHRVAAPLRLSLRHRLVVSHVREEAPGVMTMHLTGRRLDELAVLPGQFFVWRFRTGPGWTRGHPYSLSAAPTTEGLRITLGTRGDDGDRLRRVAPGTPVLLEGPYGRLTPEVRRRRGLVLLGNGLGVAPLMSLLDDAARTGVLDPRRGGRPATLVRRVRDLGPQPFAAELDALARAGLVEVVDLVGPRSTTGTAWLPEHLGHVAGPEAARLLVPDAAGCDVYVCGSATWADALAADLRHAGVPRDALHVERFS